jgi:hypothetical protein
MKRGLEPGELARSHLTADLSPQIPERHDFLDFAGVHEGSTQFGQGGKRGLHLFVGRPARVLMILRSRADVSTQASPQNGVAIPSSSHGWKRSRPPVNNVK